VQISREDDQRSLGLDGIQLVAGQRPVVAGDVVGQPLAKEPRTLGIGLSILPHCGGQRIQRMHLLQVQIAQLQCAHL
jgi:hypothetical protein